MSTVKKHQRTINGRRVNVRSHNRRGLAQRSGRNMRMAWRALNHKQRTTIVLLVGLAVVQLVLWVALNASWAGLIALGTISTAVAYAAAAAANGGMDQ